MNNKCKITLLITTVLIISLCLYFYCNNKKIIDFEHNTVSNFSTEDFGNYESIYCQETKSGTLLFPEQTCLIITSYSESSFSNNIKNLNKNYNYLENPLLYDDNNYYIIPSSSFSIGDWNFKIILSDAYPNYIDMVATNSNLHKIAYLSYVDTDRDTLCSIDDNENNKFMEKFVKKKFKYNFSE
ncbi:MAG: hypothetical protein ACLUFN_11175 [Eubacterium sp.]